MASRVSTKRSHSKDLMSSVSQRTTATQREEIQRLREELEKEKRLRQEAEKLLKQQRK